MRLLPPCGKAGAAGGPPNASPPFLRRRSLLRGEGRPKKCFPAYCLKSRNSDRIQRPLRLSRLETFPERGRYLPAGFVTTEKGLPGIGGSYGISQQRDAS